MTTPTERLNFIAAHIIRASERIVKFGEDYAAANLEVKEALVNTLLEKSSKTVTYRLTFREGSQEILLIFVCTYIGVQLEWIMSRPNGRGMEIADGGSTSNSAVMRVWINRAMARKHTLQEDGKPVERIVEKVKEAPVSTEPIAVPTGRILQNVFASDLNLRPGDFPKILNRDGLEFQRAECHYTNDEDNELVSIRYRNAQHGLSFLMYND